MNHPIFRPVNPPSEFFRFLIILVGKEWGFLTGFCGFGSGIFNLAGVVIRRGLSRRSISHIKRTKPKWRNRQTRWIQNPVGLTPVWVRVPPSVLLLKQNAFVFNTLRETLSPCRGWRFFVSGMFGSLRVNVVDFVFQSDCPTVGNS